MDEIDGDSYKYFLLAGEYDQVTKALVEAFYVIIKLRVIFAMVHFKL